MKILIFLIYIIINYDQINVYSDTKTQTCIHETFSKEDNVVIKYKIFDLKNIEIKDFKDLNVVIYDSTDKNVYNSKDINNNNYSFNFNAIKDDILSVCLWNKTNSTVLIHYEFLLNIDLNDYTTIPDYSHFRELEMELDQVENIVKKMETFIKFSEGLYNVNSKDSIADNNLSRIIIYFSAYLILFIMFIKIVEVYYIQNRLKYKKLA